MVRRDMDVWAQVGSVFHLDKCIGCHTCSLACKNLWTERPGAEYMYWNNVETKPGTGYPARWEDQETWRGGWETNGSLRLRSQNRLTGLLRLFFNPSQPDIHDYFEPWTYRYGDLFDAPEGDDQPTAVPVSRLTGRPIDIQSGPNWDDDLSGSPIYAANDPNLASLDEATRLALFEVERLTMMYLPRICNHCVNAACVAACPSGAIYKRGEDGIVLVDQDSCRGWRACVVACPYKKVFYNWKTGKSEKCILCYPRLETGQPPACFHSCVGRIRYSGVVLYDASRIEAVASAPDGALVDAIRSLLLDPSEPEVAERATRAGISAEMLDAARHSPVWKFVRQWGLALPLHPEFRTLPMLFYVPPLMPVIGSLKGEIYRRVENGDIFGAIEQMRLPVRYLASLFAAGNTGVVESSLQKMMAVRWLRRSREIGDAGASRVRRVLSEAGLSESDADQIHRLTTLATLEERYVLPPLQREQMIAEERAEERRESSGFGRITPPGRGA